MIERTSWGGLLDPEAVEGLLTIRIAGIGNGRTGSRKYNFSYNFRWMKPTTG